MAVRLQLMGSCHAHGELTANIERWINEIREDATDVSGGTVWIESIKIRTRHEVDTEAMLDSDDALAGLLRAIRDVDMDAPLLAKLRGELQELQRKLPSELRIGEDGMDLENPQLLRLATEDVKHLLLARLLSRGERP
jgi:hypothetical protein